MRQRVIISILASAILLCSCGEERKTVIPSGSDSNDKATKFEIKKIDGVWHLLKEGEVFYINGAATNNFYDTVDDFGGNAIRTYSITNQTATILDEAYKNGCYVNVGYYMKREKDGFDYGNATAVAAQLEDARTYVRRFRNHPAVMCWSVGNETMASYTDTRLWDAVEDMAAMIHEEDPNHPTTIALAGANTDHIRYIITKSPSIDILSVNSYDPSVASIINNVRAAGWDKPWMVTEFGQRGTWATTTSTTPKKLSWGALVEMTSTQKAAVYKRLLRDDIKARENDGCIGSFAFLWGYQTHGEVLTWYGLFDKNQNSFGVVDELQNSWTGSYPKTLAPVIADRHAMKMNGKIADDEIMVAKGSSNTATVTATSPSGAALTYRWLIYAEGTAASNGSLPDGISGLITDSTLPTITFNAPSTPGGQRLVVFATDETNHKAASAVIPFYVNN